MSDAITLPRQLAVGLTNRMPTDPRLEFYETDIYVTGHDTPAHGNVVCRTYLGGAGGTDARSDAVEAFAARLALAWNCHDELVEACRKAMPFLRDADWLDSSAEENDALDAIRAALARTAPDAG
jgi:hypothetical protein